MLFGFSDGALSEDGRVGAYSWLVAVKKGDTKLEVLAGGGGGAARRRLGSMSRVEKRRRCELAVSWSWTASGG